jgi:hypothetical protein
MVEMTHEDIERIWNSFSHYLPDRAKTDAAVDFVSTLKDIGVEHNEIKASSDYDPKIEEAVGSVFAEKDDDIEDYSDDNELVY